MLAEKLLVFGNCRSGKPSSTTRLSATRWGKRHPVSLPIIRLALCRSIFPHGTVFASQLVIPLQATQSSWPWMPRAISLIAVRSRLCRRTKSSIT